MILMMKLPVFYTDEFVLPLPPNHRFPMEKYHLLREYVRTKLNPQIDFIRPHAATNEELELAHSLDYIKRVHQGLLSAHETKQIGLPWSPAAVERARRSVGATIDASRAALQSGIAINLAGGTHHAFFDKGQGFCFFNDSAVAARTLQNEGLISSVIIIDCDVHQGNGTASICHQDESIFTFSIHGENNFPFTKEHSNLDIPLPDGTTDEDYLHALQQGLSYVFTMVQPDLVIYLAGADPYQGDRLGRLNLSKQGLMHRDQLVFESCLTRHIPIAICMAGGYAVNILDTVEIYFQTVQLAVEYQKLYFQQSHAF